MRILILAAGRAKATPEGALTDDYGERATAAGRPLRLGPVEVIEVEDRKDGSGRRDREAELILQKLPDGAALVALDERGETMPSEAFARWLTRQRDMGTPALAFAIGGADGHGPALLARSQKRLAFGTPTWPHLLVRAMLAEQIYRAVTIIAGHPYHRA